MGCDQIVEGWAEDFRLALVGGRELVGQGRRHTLEHDWPGVGAGCSGEAGSGGSLRGLCPCCYPQGGGGRTWRRVPLRRVMGFSVFSR